MNPETFFTHLWEDYIRMAPRAAKIKQLFEEQGETVLNDHVAFRTFGLDPIGLKTLEKPILALGYERFAPYRFEAKKLNAMGYLHPKPEYPRIFLSELEVEALSPKAQSIIQALVGQIDATVVENDDILWAGPLWSPVAYTDYEQLLEESEYAAWVAALGLHANHFTIAVNHLEKTPSLEAVLDFVESAGYAINESGGRVKGSPDVLLEQGSTLADRMEVNFADGIKRSIPTCYYEFARRYKGPDGALYNGFVAASADKIFESTNTKQ
ncbi:DUF1338 domain-containing protein [Puniceicoccales bacterium CK1056]|uniref:2-oxoadipate dioxygenase/decarboxylase n=1 Tax=Oceanipulchritudo coccoides TaxID=2706888 RepID=A0A6B2M3T6_9BACT|nr:DUF1338 domain-containing protein [Oceanipulchritudo coccoides]NDV62962.1 DUF1338 domain-containing protein [Oceanipulchritudo coccoides]